MAISLTCLGTADAFGSAGRHCAGYLVDTPDTQILLDAGPSILPALKSLGLASAGIDIVVLSHLHGDHFGGIPFLLLEYKFESPRTRPLTIVGPPGTQRRIFELYRALYAKLCDHKPLFDLRFVELGDKGTYREGDVQIDSFRVPHMEDEISLGHRVQVGKESIVYSGDTAWTDALLEHSRNADLFLCECSTFETVVPKHIRYTEIEANRSRFECERLLLTHLGREIRARSTDVAEELATDGLRVELGARDKVGVSTAPVAIAPRQVSSAGRRG